MYDKLDPEEIVATLEKLEHRVVERFPGSGLTKVAAELTAIARRTQARATAIARPDWRLRGLVALLLLIGVALLAVIAALVLADARTGNELFDILQGIDSAFNIIVLMGAALFFMVTLEERLKRQKSLKALHELRSIIHVIDMHQLTKDPGMRAEISAQMPTSPKRTLSVPELVRYLDYCSEMLSLSAKVAALYAQGFPDPVVTDAVNDLERTSTSLSQKIWQKINILYRRIEADLPHTHRRPAPAAPGSPPASEPVA